MFHKEAGDGSECAVKPHILARMHLYMSRRPKCKGLVLLLVFHSEFGWRCVIMEGG